MNPFWEVRWGDVFAYGVLPPFIAVGIFLAWKLARAVVRSLRRQATHRAATRVLRVQRPAPDGRWCWLDWQWAFSQTANPEAIPYRDAAARMSSGMSGGPRLSPVEARSCLIMVAL